MYTEYDRRQRTVKVKERKLEDWVSCVPTLKQIRTIFVIIVCEYLFILVLKTSGKRLLFHNNHKINAVDIIPLSFNHLYAKKHFFKHKSYKKRRSNTLFAVILIQFVKRRYNVRVYEKKCAEFILISIVLNRNHSFCVTILHCSCAMHVCSNHSSDILKHFVIKPCFFGVLSCH